jgi:hypothetical protein
MKKGGSATSSLPSAGPAEAGVSKSKAVKQ